MRAGRRHRLSLWGMALWLLPVAACQTPPLAPPTAPPPLAVVVTPTAWPTPRPRPTITPSLTPSPSPSPTITPTPTPRRLALPADAPTFILPDGWATVTAEALDSAEFALQPTSDGIPIGRRPLVLAVPFTTAWENVTWAEAQSILADGHQLVTIMPWSDLTPDLKPLRIDGLYPDDPAYPLQESWSLRAAPDQTTAAVALADQLRPTFAAEPVMHLVAVGDLMLARALGYQIAQGNTAFPFQKVVEPLRAGDITVGNLESALGDRGAPVVKSYTFQAPPAAVDALAWAGFDVVSLANNHALDYGPTALLQALDLLQAQNIAVIGAGPDATTAHTAFYTTTHGLRLAFLGYVHVPVESRGFVTESWTATATTPGVAWAYPEVVAADVQAALPNVDHVIVVLHSGYEYQAAPSPPQIAAAHAAIDAGATMVIGHHAHILQGIEFYNGGVIVYGLGNFAFEIDGDPATAILNAWLDQDGVRSLELIPALIQFGGQPRLAEAWEAPAIAERVYYLTRLLNAPTP